MSTIPESPVSPIPPAPDVPLPVDAGAESEAAAGPNEVLLGDAVTTSLHRASMALMVLATLFSMYAMHVARDFLVPVVMAMGRAYLRDPQGCARQGLGLRRAAASTVVLLALLGALLSCAYLLQGQVESIVNSLPEMASKLSRSVGALMSGDESMWQKIRRAATVLSGTGQPPPARGTHVVVDQAPGQINNMLLAGSVSIFTMAGQAVVLVFLLYFLMLAGDTFKRKFIKMVGTTISEKKVSVHMLDEVNLSIRR